MASVDAPNHDVTFAIIGLSDGKTYLSASKKESTWQSILLVTQDYLIHLIGGTSPENFTLNVNTPARIIFDPGAISATRAGSTPGGLDVSYILRANINQKMDLNLQAPPGKAVLAIYGYQDGNPYLRYVVEATTFSMSLPATEDYVIQVVPYAGEVVDYTLDITVK
jgi:hypothetical protein